MKVKYLLIAVVVVFAAGFLFAVSSEAKIDTKTIAGMWLFNEGQGKVANDSSGNGNNGDLMNGRLDDLDGDDPADGRCDGTHKGYGDLDGGEKAVGMFLELR